MRPLSRKIQENLFTTVATTPTLKCPTMAIAVKNVFYNKADFKVLLPSRPRPIRSAKEPRSAPAQRGPIWEKPENGNEWPP